MNAPIVFLDTETTSLRPDRRMWEIGLIARVPVTVRHPDGPDTCETEDREHRWFIDASYLDLGNADPMALKIGRFYDRHPQYRLDHPAPNGATETEYDALRLVEAFTRGAHLVGAVGYLRAHAAALEKRDSVDDLADAASLRGLAEPPWRSGDLSAALDVTVSEDERHTALGDARWAMRIYDAVMSGRPR